MSRLKFYGDTLSQPCRAVILLLEKEGVPYEFVEVSLTKRETNTNEDLGRINPQRLLPAIDDKGFTLFESSAILKYLVEAYRLSSHWYPQDPKVRAKIDQYLAWHGTNIRSHFYFYMAIAPAFGAQFPKEKLEESKVTFKASLEMFQDYFLRGEGPFICGSEISIADLQCLCEMTMYWMTKTKVEDLYPKIGVWMKACEEWLGECFKKVHEVVYKTREGGMFAVEWNFD